MADGKARDRSGRGTDTSSNVPGLVPATRGMHIVPRHDRTAPRLPNIYDIAGLISSVEGTGRDSRGGKELRAEGRVVGMISGRQLIPNGESTYVSPGVPLVLN